MAAQQRERQKRRMALVQVVGFDLEAERAEHPLAADAEHRFLAQAQHLVTAVKPVRDAAVLGGVHLELCVKQQHRHAVPERAGQDAEPGADPDRATLEPDRHRCVERRGPIRGLPWIRVVHLPPVRADLLPQVPLAAGKRHEDHRQLEVSGRAGGVAREDAEAAGVGVDPGVQRHLHREVGDARPCEEGVEGRGHGGLLSGKRGQGWSGAAAP